MITSIKQRGSISSGFSAVEVLMVVAILIILGAIALPGFMVWREDSNLNGVVRQVQSDLMWARMEAVQRSRAVTVIFKSGQPEYTISVSGGETVTHTVAQEFKGIQVGSDFTLRFEPRGVAKIITGSSVSLSNSQGTKTLSVNVAGRVSVQ